MIALKSWKKFIRIIKEAQANNRRIKTTKAKYKEPISLAKGISIPRPNLPTVKEIKANTPIGANFITYQVNLNIISATLIARVTTGLPFSPIAAAATPKKQENRIICSISPRPIASTTLVGTMLTNICVISIVFFAAAAAELTSAPVAMATPAPGWKTFATVNPTKRANVVATSNQIRDFAPKRPNFLKSPVPAIPIINELKIKGTTIILIIRINVSPIGFNACP